MSTESIPRANIFGVGVSAIDISQALQMIDGWIHRREQNYVCVTGVHGIMESQRDMELKRIHNRAGLVTPDGMPLVWLSHLKGFSWVQRVYGPDLMLAVCKQSLLSGYRHYFYGGAEGVPERLVTCLAERFSGLRIAGYWSPPFRSLTCEEDERSIEMINETEPDIVWIGLSTPKQEYWMHQHLGRVKAPVMIGVGAAFDFNAGIKKQAPRAMQKTGLEWLYRLIHEPRRLWKRYLVCNTLFLWYLLRENVERRTLKVER